MNYIGSKLSLLAFLEESINKVVDPEKNGASKNCHVFCDLFAGTGIVGNYFKQKGYKIIANDIQYYSYVLNKHYIENHKELKNIEIKQRKDFVCDYLSNLKGAKGFIYKNYCLGGTKNQKEQRQYFSDENGMRCDGVRQKIEKWEKEKLINKNEYYFLLTSLLESIDKYANTASVYGAFLKNLSLKITPCVVRRTHRVSIKRKFGKKINLGTPCDVQQDSQGHSQKTAQKNLILKPAELIINEQDHEVFNEDINEVAKKVNGDILYLDPPYNHRQYSTNYHLLETIAKYDNPKIHGKTGLREYEKQKSAYCSRQGVKKAFKDLILNSKVKYIFLSYNNEGLMSLDDIKEIMSLRGKYSYFTKEYNRFKADKSENRNYKSSKTIEYLHYAVCK